MPLYMMYLDLEELPGLFKGRLLYSSTRPAPARFRRSDYLGDPREDLGDAVRDAVVAQTGERPRGPIRLLTHLRHFGHCFNPVSFYYCFDEAGERVETIAAQITNTPWKERHSYVLPREDSEGGGSRLRFSFGKAFHVSPFMPMEQRYEWSFNEPGDRIGVHMRNREESGEVFDATLSLRRREISGASLNRALIRFPLITVQVVARIHYEALRLWLKRVPVCPHPDRLAGNTGTGGKG